MAFGRILPLVVIASVLAGCASPDSDGMSRASKATMIVDFCHEHPGAGGQRKNDTYVREFDPESRPSQPAYDGHAFAHPANYTVHDLLYEWSADEGIAVGTPDAPHPEWGYYITAIDGVAGNATHFWGLYVNDRMADGMSVQPVADGDGVRLTFEPCA
jgi:hypothetical protein